AKQAAHLTVFQRTPAFSLDYVPQTLSKEERDTIFENFDDYVHKSRTTPAGQWTETLPHSALEESEEDRLATYEERWQRHR
ncbi:hypothetical protein NPM13_33210, partial [Bacillus cereus]|nr:hypothetical protein [Bacillus cereus]